MTEKQKQYKEKMEETLNPFEDFDPENFEPLATEEDRKFLYRKRINPPKELPTFHLKPKEIMEGQMIGMYESKQDIYLILAHRCNDLQKQIDELNNKLNDLYEGKRK